MQEKALERLAEEESQKRMNAAAYNVQDYKSRLINEHNTILKSQLEQAQREKQILQDAKRQDDQINASRHQNVNSQLLASEHDLRRQQVQRYKEELDNQVRQ